MIGMTACRLSALVACCGGEASDGGGGTATCVVRRLSKQSIVDTSRRSVENWFITAAARRVKAATTSWVGSAAGDLATAVAEDAVTTVGASVNSLNKISR